MKQQTKLMLGDNMESLKKLPDNSIDSIVTDPPYGLSFMGKKWDYDVPTVEFWREVYRVLKPGGHILSFGGTRTYHRMAVNIEDAGFEIRDQVMWLYGSGFPKSHNIGKAVDKIEGNEREVVMKNPYADGSIRKATGNVGGDDNVEFLGSYELENGLRKDTKGQSKYEGWGTALKPANEPICVARKPLSEKTIADNVIKWSTGGINIDGCRVGTDDKLSRPVFKSNDTNIYGGGKGMPPIETLGNDEGRFPANIILECICDEVIKGKKGEPFLYKGKEYNNKDLVEGRSVDFMKGSKADAPNNYNDSGDIHTNPDCVCYQLDEQSGVLKSGVVKEGHKRGKTLGEYQGSAYGKYNNTVENLDPSKFYGDKGGASRFFYVAKVSKKERNLGLDGFEEKIIEGRDEGQDERSVAYKKRPIPTKNTHPTLKPINLMTYLCRLITPEGGIILDPFMGSGSTGISARLEGFRFVGMELDEEYFKIAEARIEAYEEYRKLLK